MANTDYSFDGLDKLEQQLATMVEQTYPEEFKKMVIQVAYELQGKVKQLTPVKTSRLADSWVVGPIKKIGDEYLIEVYTNVEYAAPVNYGHRTPNGNGFVKGVHMMEIALEEVDNALTPYMRNWLSDFISTHNL